MHTKSRAQSKRDGTGAAQFKTVILHGSGSLSLPRTDVSHAWPDQEDLPPSLSPAVLLLQGDHELARAHSLLQLPDTVLNSLQAVSDDLCGRSWLQLSCLQCLWQEVLENRPADPVCGCLVSELCKD